MHQVTSTGAFTYPYMVVFVMRTGRLLEVPAATKAGIDLHVHLHSFSFGLDKYFAYSAIGHIDFLQDPATGVSIFFI